MLWLIHVYYNLFRVLEHNRTRRAQLLQRVASRPAFRTRQNAPHLALRHKITYLPSSFIPQPARPANPSGPFSRKVQ